MMKQFKQLNSALRAFSVEVLYLPSDSSPPQLFTSAGTNMASLNSSRTWEVLLPPHVISLRRFNIVLT